MTVQPDDIVRCAQHFTWDGSDDFVNVWHYQHQGSNPAADGDVMDDLASEIDGVTGALLTHQSTSLAYGLIEFYNITQDVPMGSRPHPVNTAGTGAGEPLPTQCAALLSFRTGEKKSVGRRYLAGFTETANDNGGELSSGLLTALATYAAACVTGSTIAGELFVPGHVRKATGAFSKWVLPVIDTLYRTQRRRVQGVGR